MNAELKINNKDHVQGPKNASLELIEYGDYQCPYCGKAYYVIKEVQKELGDQLTFVFRNFPLTELHPYAMHAAMAAEVAAGQDKFWEMHDMLFENQRSLADPALIEYTQQIGLDTTKFEQDFGKDEYFEKINEDYKSSVRCNVQGTPAFFVNGEEFTGNWMEPEFAEYLRSLI